VARRDDVERRPWPLAARVVAGAGIGWFLVDLGQGGKQGWCRPIAAGLLAAVGAGSVATVRRWGGRAVGTGSCLMAFAGIYLCVPETERIAAATLIVAILFVGEVTGQLPARWPTTLAAATVAVWAAYYGGVFRDSALVGGFASLGLVVLEPLAVRLPGPRRGIPPPYTAPALLVLQGAYAVTVARQAGLRHDVTAALAIAVPLAVALVVAARLVVGRRRWPTGTVSA
jgi:hypothetical protein